MFRNLLVALLLAIPAAAATGEAIGLVVFPSGWEAEVRVDDIAIGGTANLNWDTNRTINPASPPSIKLTVQSPGRTGASTGVVTRYIYVSDNMRKPYPDHATKDERIDGGDAVIKLALTDYIGAEDIITEASFANAWYTSATATILTTSITNSSEQSYHKSIVNPLTPPNERVTNSYTVWIGGGHWSAENGKPIEWLEVIATDESGDSVTNTPSTTWSLDSDFHALAPANTFAVPGVPVTLDLSTLTDGDLISIRVRAVGKIGNSASIFDSTLDDPGVATPNQLPFTKTILKRSTAYGGVAVVSTSAGASPTVHPEGTDPASIPSTDYYGTPATAWAAVKTYNNSNYSHNDAGGGIVYYRTGVATYLNANTDLGVMETWAIAQEYPGDDWVLSANGSSASGTGEKILVIGAELNHGNVVDFSSIDELWLDQCVFTSSGTGPFNNIKVLHVTRSTAASGWTFGFKTAAGGTAITHGIFRENDFSNIAGPIEGPQTFVGNYIITPGSSFALKNGSSTWNSFATRPGPDYQVWYNFHVAFNQTQAGNIASDFALTNGMFMANYVLEGMINSVAFTIASDNGKATTNLFMVNGLSRGVRHQFGYNETGSTATPRNRNVIVNSIMDVLGNAHDTGGTPDANRIGGWPVNWRVGFSGIFDLILTNMPTHGDPAVNALHSYRPASSTSFTWTNFTQFVDDQAWVNTGGEASGGNYRLMADSKIRTNSAYRMRFVMPLDLAGVARSSNSPAGPFTSGDFHVKKTGNDSNVGSEASPWLTVQKAANTMVAGDTVTVWPGYYDETVTTGNSGTADGYVKFLAKYPNTNSVPDESRVKAFRIQDRYQWIEGFHIVRGGADLNNAMVRVEYNGSTVDGSYLMLTNNTIRDTPLIVSTNAWFIGSSNAMSVTDVYFTNFTSGDLVFLGADSHNWHTNHDTAHVVDSVSSDGRTIFFTGATTITNDSGTGYWAPLYAGTGNAGYQGILNAQGTGSTASSNLTIINNVISNIFGNNLNLNGNPGGHLVKGNTFAGMKGRYAFRLNSANTIIEDNLIYEGGNIIWFTQFEIENIEHPPGGDWYDYQANIMDAQATAGIVSTNNIIRRNWFENLDNQAGLWTGRQDLQYGLTLESNVFVGIQAQGGGAMDNLTYRNNTFYRVGFDPANNRTIALGLGGTGNNPDQTDLVVTNNAFIDVGSHRASTRMTEGGYTIDGPNTTNPLATNNFIAGPEMTGWENKTGVHAGHNFNGNPLLVDPLNPRGADGLPFTADDGLRPLPTSTLAINNLGALASITVTTNVPVAHFTAIPAAGYDWYDATGTNYDNGWVTNYNPGLRGGNLRPWDTPEALGNVPCTVHFTATNSLSGMGNANLYSEILGYWWDFGDGATISTRHPFVSHTYLTTGEMTVVVWLTNRVGNADSFTNRYRILPKTITNQVLYVSSSIGDNSNPGTNQNAPKLTIGSTVSMVGPGSYVAVLPGDYDELVNLNGANGEEANRITYIGYGATNNAWEMRKPHYTVSRFKMDGGGVSGNGAVVRVYRAADGAWVSHNRFGGSVTTNIFAVLFEEFTGGEVQIPANSATNCLITNNVVIDHNHIVFNVQGRSNVLRFNWIEGGNGQVDIFRAWGEGHYFQDNFITNISPIFENHSDFFQTFGTQESDSDYISFGTNAYRRALNMVFERNEITDSRVQICQLEAYKNTNAIGSFTNLIFRNNIFNGSSYGANLDMDGTKWFNNLFYKVNTNGGHIFFFGGTKGDAFGTEIKNNAFIECGSDPANTSFGWYQRMEPQGIVNYSLEADYNFVTGTANAAKSTAGANGWGASGGVPSNTWEQNGVNGGDPMFVDTANGDFRLLEGSPLLGVGVTLAGFDTDFFGADRGSTWDIGPIQGSTAGEPPPDPPSGGIQIIRAQTARVGTISSP